MRTDQSIELMTKGGIEALVDTLLFRSDLFLIGLLYRLYARENTIFKKVSPFFFLKRADVYKLNMNGAWVSLLKQTKFGFINIYVFLTLVTVKQTNLRS